MALRPSANPTTFKVVILGLDIWSDFEVQSWVVESFRGALLYSVSGFHAKYNNRRVQITLPPMAIEVWNGIKAAHAYELAEQQAAARTRARRGHSASPQSRSVRGKSLNRAREWDGIMNLSPSYAGGTDDPHRRGPA
jgi:hypothetical protein